MIVLIIILIILLIIIIINELNKHKLKNYFKKSNVIVYGKKGSGKDVLMDYIATSKKEYYSNVPYSKQPLELVNPNDLKLGNNTFESLLNGKVEKTQWPYKEGTDFFISDCGVYLPSQYDYILHKKYGGLPLLYALSRHIGKHNIHCNAQNLERIWKPLREQADIYIKVIETINLPFFLLTKYRVYDKYQSAVQDVRITKQPLLKKDSNITVHQANVGSIEEGWILRLKKNVKYNSRYFKDVFIEG